MAPFIRVQAITPKDDHTAEVVFTNGETRMIDLMPYIAEGAIFAPIRQDPTMFRRMAVAGGTIVWPNGADIDPDVLYYNGRPPWAQPLVLNSGHAAEEAARSKGNSVR